MESQLRFEVEWAAGGLPEDTTGPEKVTWAETAIWLDGDCLTRHTPANRPGVEPVNAVTGPLVGLVEWVVENWLFLSHEQTRPFAQEPLSGDLVKLPGYIEATKLWNEGTLDEQATDLFDWLHRHLFGHASSNLALPSLVMQPEGEWMIVAVDDLPAKFGPTVEFTGPREGAWPRVANVRKDKLLDQCAAIVEQAIERGNQSADAGQWARWIEQSFEAARADARDHFKQLVAALGEVGARRVHELLAKDDVRGRQLHSLLLDSPSGASSELVGSLVDWLGTPSSAKPATPRDWSTFAGTDWFGPPFRQGYDLARKVRRELLNEPLAPLADLASTLGDLGVAVRDGAPTPAFRTAVAALEDGTAIMWTSPDDPRVSSVARTRFAQAAALGRLLTSPCRAAAHGPYARLRETQRANAFAAELLLPSEALDPCVNLDRIVEAYGISRSAAAWHVRNAGCQYV